MYIGTRLFIEMEGAQGKKCPENNLLWVLILGKVISPPFSTTLPPSYPPPVSIFAFALLLLILGYLLSRGAT